MQSTSQPLFPSRHVPETDSMVSSTPLQTNSLLTREPAKETDQDISQGNAEVFIRCCLESGRRLLIWGGQEGTKSQNDQTDLLISSFVQIVHPLCETRATLTHSTLFYSTLSARAKLTLSRTSQSSLFSRSCSPALSSAPLKTSLGPRLPASESHSHLCSTDAAPN